MDRGDRDIFVKLIERLRERTGDHEALLMAEAIEDVLAGLVVVNAEDYMKLYTGECDKPTGNIAVDGVAPRCKMGTIGCKQLHRRRATDVILAEARMEVIDRVLAEWAKGTSAERNMADDLRAELDKVQVPKG